MVPDRSHGGHWRVVATLVGIALACMALWVALKPREPDIAAKQDLQHQHPDYRPGGPECNPQWLDGLSGRYADGIRQTCAEAAEEHRLKTNDLVQQTRSADAAETIVWLTYDQARIAQSGTLFSFLTLIAASAAAYFAWKAAQETGRSANIAKDALDLSRRGYLFPSNFQVHKGKLADASEENFDETHVFIIEVKFTNLSAAPAVMIPQKQSRRLIKAADDPSKIDWSAASADSSAESAVGPGVEIGVMGIELSVSEAISVFEKDLASLFSLASNTEISLKALTHIKPIRDMKSYFSLIPESFTRATEGVCPSTSISMLTTRSARPTQSPSEKKLSGISRL